MASRAHTPAQEPRAERWLLTGEEAGTRRNGPPFGVGEQPRARSFLSLQHSLPITLCFHAPVPSHPGTAPPTAFPGSLSSSPTFPASFRFYPSGPPSSPALHQHIPSLPGAPWPFPSVPPHNLLSLGSHPPGAWSSVVPPSMELLAWPCAPCLSTSSSPSPLSTPQAQFLAGWFLLQTLQSTTAPIPSGEALLPALWIAEAGDPRSEPPSQALLMHLLLASFLLQ